MSFSHVILVDENDREIGAMEKMQAHEEGLLHRAFSIFIINDHSEMLLQKRASSKYHSPSLWTNACCSHPGPNQNTLTAAIIRLKEEMGFDCALTEIGSFTYRTQFDNGLTEFEYDHVFVGTYNSLVNPNPMEVDEYKWLSYSAIDNLLKTNNEEFTSWFKIAYPLAKNWIQNKTGL